MHCILGPFYNQRKGQHYVQNSPKIKFYIIVPKHIPEEEVILTTSLWPSISFGNTSNKAVIISINLCLVKLALIESSRDN